MTTVLGFELLDNYEGCALLKTAPEGFIIGGGEGILKTFGFAGMAACPLACDCRIVEFCPVGSPSGAIGTRRGARWSTRQGPHWR